MLRQGIWKFSTNEYHIFTWRDEEKGVLRMWDVRESIPKLENENEPKPVPRFAAIMATEKDQNHTLVEFFDGTDSVGLRRGFKSDRPIGEDFVKIADEIVSKWEGGITANIPSEPKTQSLNDWFDYFHAVGPRLRIRMDYIAKKTNLTVSTVYKAHAIYMREHGIPSQKNKVRKR